MSRSLIWHSLADVPVDLGATAVAIGNFDGVHRGHREVLARLRRIAAERGLAPVAMTFWPHPRHVCVSPGDPHLVTGQEERDRLLLLTGLRGVLDLEFTLEFAQHSPEDFVRIFLVEGLGMRCIVMGADSRFGKDNAGDLATMRRLGDEMGFDVVTVEDLGASGEGERSGAPDPTDRISSSAVRSALEAGDVAAAARMLGRHHTVSDIVHHGFKRGRELGFPTANLGPHPSGLVPADGVYAGYLTVIEQAPEHLGTDPLAGAPATISVGTNPTFHADGEDEPPRLVEAYVHTDADLDLYGDRVRIEFVDRQRPTLRFDSVEALVEQMGRDLDVTRRTLASDDLGSPPED
ncbi:bifunctional riboflavin kinase/FAD synthetase [Brachybacterium sp. AOP25-B2-12]|uniref:bifunctional riboflavin kinase/FAD synthetase n=1 Tax=Brachybacterium sp. AOP25-B2-12 TaxID=3457710 RepID=UPI004034ADC9